MNLPKIGEIVYGFQHEQDRPGETMFLCSTQANCTSDKEIGTDEALEVICDEGCETEIDGEWIAVINPENIKNLVVWEMKRIR